MDCPSQTDQPSLPTNIFTVNGPFDPAVKVTELHLANGHVIRLDTSSLTGNAQVGEIDTGAFSCKENFSLSQEVSVPVVEERLTIEKRVRETGRVRLQKTLQMHEEALDEQLAVSTFDIERVPHDEPVDAPPPVRQEGNTTIYPVVEERLILTKQLILIEEVHVTRLDTQRRETRTVELMREHLAVEREAL